MLDNLVNKVTQLMVITIVTVQIVIAPKIIQVQKMAILFRIIIFYNNLIILRIITVYKVHRTNMIEIKITMLIIIVIKIVVDIIIIIQVATWKE